MLAPLYFNFRTRNAMTDTPKSPTPGATPREAINSLVKNVNALRKLASEQRAYDGEIAAVLHVTTAMIDALLPRDATERKDVEKRFLIACDRIRPDELGPKPDPKLVAAYDRNQLAWQARLRTKP
jgi:hypothetical protein